MNVIVGAPAAAARSRTPRKYGRRKYQRRSSSRKRSSSRGLSYYQKRAIARKAYVRGKWPSSEWAHPRIRRGGALAQSMGMVPGQSYKDATVENQLTRKASQWYGPGAYSMDPRWLPPNGGNVRPPMRTQPWQPISGTGLYSGRGGFFGGIGGLLTGKGYKAGSAMGDEIYEKVGRYGDSLGRDFGKYFGGGLYGRGAYGDAPVTNDLIMAGQNSDDVVPRFHPTDISEVMYSNREYIGDLYAPSSGAFTLTKYDVNPGLMSTFPWVSQLAMNFEEYEMFQLAFTFKTTIGEVAVTNGQSGSIYMATQMNPDSRTFANKEEMMMYNGSGSSKITQHQIQGVECDPTKIAGSPQKYVRFGNVPTGEDKKDYDLGILSIALENVPNTYWGQQVGELWVSYTMKLRKPRLVSGNAYNCLRDVFMTDGATAPSILGNPGGSTLIAGARNSLGCTIIQPATTTESVLVGLGGLTASGAYVIADDLWKEKNQQLSTTYPFYQRSFNDQNTQANCGVIVFPDSFAGIAEISIFLNTGGSVISNALNVFWTLNSTGNITRFLDLPSVYGYSQAQQMWSHKHYCNGDGENWAASGYAAPVTGKIQMVKIHVRVQKASLGIKNRICISPFATAQAGFNTCINYVEIHAYNTSLSYQDNGSKDDIALVSATGGVVTYP